jgi:hypothetical protein
MKFFGKNMRYVIFFVFLYSRNYTVSRRALTELRLIARQPDMKWIVGVPQKTQNDENRKEKNTQ